VISRPRRGVADLSDAASAWDAGRVAENHAVTILDPYSDPATPGRSFLRIKVVR